MYPGNNDLDLHISFVTQKLSFIEKNYRTIEREGLAMVYTLQKLWHYLLGGHFKMFFDHSKLKYIVNKPVVGGNIWRWLPLFQEFDFEIIVNLVRLNAGPDHLSIIEMAEEPTNTEDGIPDARCFELTWNMTIMHQ